MRFATSLALLVACFACATAVNQHVRVKGKFLCGDKPLTNAKVKLWDNDFGPDPDDLLAEAKLDESANGEFDLSGSTSEIGDIEPRIKVYHDCDDKLANYEVPCQRKMKWSIPQSYVVTSQADLKPFDLGTINVQAKAQGEERDCFN